MLIMGFNFQLIRKKEKGNNKVEEENKCGSKKAEEEKQGEIRSLFGRREKKA